jgi:DNA-dependent protein kinase catalytic subunit
LEANFIDGHRYEQISTAMDRIQRVFIEKSSVFHASREKRLQPEGFDGKTLFDVLKWIFFEAAQSEYFYRHKCMEMFLAIVPECGTKEEFFENHLTVEKVLSVGELKHKDLNYLKNFQQQSLFKETWKWMNDLLRSMDYYIWILENEIIPKNLISELLEKSKTLDSLEFFLNEIVLKDLEGTFRSIDPHLIGTSERSMEFRFISQNREEMDLYRCIILVRFIDFITIVCNEVKVGQFLIQNQENLIKVTKQLIFKPQKRGFDYKTKHSILKLPKRLIKFTQKINDESPEEFKLAIMDCLKQSFFKHLTFIAQTFDSIVAERAVGIDNINKLNGIELIFLSGRHNFSYICIDEGLNGVTAETLIVKIFNSLVNKIGEVFRPKHVTPNVQNFMVKIMQLCLKADNFIPKIIELILNNDVLQTSNNCKTFHGDYFLQTFKNTIFGYFIENLLTTTETIIQRYEQDSMKFKIISILTELNAFIFQYHKQNEQLLVKNLNQMKIYWRQIITQSTNMNNEMNCVDLALINLVTHMAMVCPIPLHEFGHSLPELENRIFSILESTQNSLEIKAKAISLLPLVTSINDAENEGLMKVLLSLLSFLPRKSSELKEGSIKLATFISFSKELFKVLLISRSPIIFRFIVIATVSDDKYLLETNLQQVQCELMEDYLDMKGQEIMLATLFKAFSKHNTEIRLSFVTRYLQALMKSAKIDVMLNFFKEQIDGIWRMSELPYANENSSNLINRSIAFLIIEAFYASVPKSKIDSTEFMISGRIMKGNEMTKFFIKNCRDRRKDIFNVDNREAQEMFRKYHCYVYRALATMISNTNTFPEVYDGFLFEENDRFGMIWEKLIDCKNEKLFGEFQQEFEEYPKIRQYITSVRDLKTSGESKNYGNTNSIFDKSLSQSLTKNDLTYSVILTGREMLINDQLQAENEHQKTICINLESTPINDHEVMTVLIGVVNHMFESKISPHHDLQNADMKKFSWVIKLANSITDGKPNVKLFLVKLVDNCRNVFIHYAQYLFLPILRTITDQKLFNKMSFFYTDLVTMLLSWSTVYKPKPTNIQEKDKIVEILIFLIDNHYHEKNEIFRLNLELIKKVCETWKDCLENNLPIFPLFNLMNLENHRIKCGIQVNAVILFNGLIPWRNDTERDQFVNEILKCLQQNDDKIYKPAAQLLGMCLNNNVESERTAVLTDKTIECLNKIRKTTTDINKFLQILYGIQKSYPKILDTFLATIKSSIPSAMRKIKCIYLEMYLSRLENDGDMVYFEIMAFQIKDLLKQNEYQLLSLFIVNKSLEFLKINQAMELVEEMKPLFKSPRDDVRKLLIEVIINVNEKFKNDSNFDRKYLYGILLKGFSDNNIEVQNRIVNFFFNESELPIQTIPRFLMILDDLYVPELEKDFLHYATVFLMEVAIRNPRSKDKLIDYDPTRDQNYTEFKIPTKSSVQQSLAPMFIPSQTRNRSMILATQANDTLQFAPTQDPVQSTQSSQTFELKEAQNTLIFSLKPQYLDSKSNLVSNENITSINYSSEHLNVLESLRKRIVRKNDDEKSRGYAMRAVEKRNFNIDQRKEKLKKLQEGREVQIYRRYRQGDYPDFFFTSLSILLPLKALVMKDPAIARDVFINIFQSLVILVKDDENDVNEKMFFESVNRCVMKILQNTKQNDTFLIATLLDMTMKSEKYLEISPNVLANVVTANNLIVSGILFLENQLKFLIKNKQDIEQQAKRRKLQENSNEDEILTHWLKILDLFYKINEYEIIQGIFAEKLNLIPEVREQLNKAIDFESNSQFKDASEIYKILLEENAPRNYTETDVMLQSYYNCLENLTDWSEISNSIKGHFESYNDIWKESNHHEVLLPHLLKSEVRLILNGKVDATFTQILEDWMNDEEKCNYLRENFPEEIVMLNLVEDKFNEAFVEVEKSLRNCADEWSCLERIDEKMICLKNARILAELNNFTYLMSTNSKEKFQSLLSRIHQSWKNSKAKPADSLVQWRDLTCYREVFHDAIKRIHGENSDNLSNEFSSIDQSLLDLQHSLLDVAFMQKNCDAANFLIKILKQEAENDPIKEKVSKYYLSKSKLILMKTELDFVSPIQRYELLQKGLKTLVSKVLNEERREFKKFPRLFVETYECASDFSWKLCNLLRDNEEFETSQLIALIKRNPTENQTITSHLLAYSEQQLKNARNIAQQFLDRNFSVENELLLAESYFKLGKFYHQAFDSGCDVSSGIQQGIFKSIFRSISYGSIESKIYIPFILNLPDLKNKKLTSDFNNALNLVPIWMFLPYIPQILSNYNFDNESYLDTLLMKIAKKYPNGE